MSTYMVVVVVNQGQGPQLLIQSVAADSAAGAGLKLARQEDQAGGVVHQYAVFAGSASLMVPPTQWQSK